MMCKSVVVLMLMLMLLPVAECVFAQENGAMNVAEYMSKETRGRVAVVQPSKLAERLDAKHGSKDNRTTSVGKNTVGYRIQIFADNNQRTAKNEAVMRERIIASRYPEIGCYLTYKAPAWRLRIGDYRTREEAVEVMNQLKKDFPAFSREMIVVVDRINVAL